MIQEVTLSKKFNSSEGKSEKSTSSIMTNWKYIRSNAYMKEFC